MKFYEKTWFTVIMLLLFFPVGLFLMWKYQKFNKIARIIISVFFGFLIIGNLFGESESNQTGTTAIEETDTISVEAEVETEEPTAEEVVATEEAAKKEQEKVDAAAKKAEEEEAARKAEEEMKKKEEAEQAAAEALELEEMLFDADLQSQVNELGNGLGLIGELFILLSSDPMAGQSEEFEYASGEIYKMLDRMMENANELDAPPTREQAKTDYIQIIEKTQQASDAGINGVKALDTNQITEGGILMNEVNQMLEEFLATHY